MIAIMARSAIMRTNEIRELSLSRGMVMEIFVLIAGLREC